MAGKTLYTALGHFRCRHDGGGRRYPVILMDHREFGMDPQEMTLWTALCWRLTDRQRAEDFYEELSNGMELFPRRSFSDCLDRLVTRGLVAKGSGTTDFDALYDLLGELYVVPISSSFPLKVVTFLKLLCSGTAPGSAATLFRRDRRTEPERHIMDLSRCAPLSTAELVRCAECDISATIQPLIYRLVCSNGMVINDAKTRRNHVGRAATSEEDFSIYSNETLLADDHAFVLKIKDTVRAAISEARFAQVVSRMRESTEAMLDTKQLPAVVKLASSSFGITEDESNGVLEHLITGGDFSLYGLANAVTRFSQDVESYDRATKLEEIGYSVMTMSPALFRQMNRTELLAA